MIQIYLISHYQAPYNPISMEDQLHLYKYEFPLLKDHSCQASFHLVEQITNLIKLTKDAKGAFVVLILWQLDLQLPVQSVPITTNVLSLNPTDGKVNSIELDKTLATSRWFCIGECPSNSPFLKNNGAEAHCF